MCLKLRNELKKAEFDSPIERAVILELADVANELHETWIAIKSRETGKMDLERSTGYKKRAIGNAIQRLEKKRWIIVQRVAGKGNRYFINNPAARTLQLKQLGALAAPAGARNALNPSIPIKKEGHSAALKPVDRCPISNLALPEGVSGKQWLAYLEIRELKGGLNTKYVVESLLSKLFEVSARSGDASASLDACINNGWLDINPVSLVAKHPKKLSSEKLITPREDRRREVNKLGDLTNNFLSKHSSAIQ